MPAIIEEVRLQFGKSHETPVTSDEAFDTPENMALAFILQAAANYLALRAHASPNYNGIALDTEEGWQLVMEMLESVARGSEPERCQD